jgi:ElaB/YqjD/DUF883 family membrane-anchored ribosome-binding protein
MTFCFNSSQQELLMQITTNGSANSKNAEVQSDVTSGVAREFHSFVADIEDLIKATTNLTGEELNRAKAKLNQRIAAAKGSVEDISETIVNRARKTAESTNTYVHEQPWNAIGASAAVGLLLGYLLARRS